ncbi:MAG TPA: porin family protein [Prevotella sp.]
MKKIFAMSLVVLSLCFATSVQAQVKFGLKGGLNITNMSFNKDVFNTSNHTGFYIGPTAKFSLPIGFGVDAAALYDQRQAKLDDAQTIKQQSINIPINLRYNIGLGSLASLYLAAGPQLGFNVGDDDFKWNGKETYTNTFQFKKSNFSINLGAGVSLIKHLEVGFTYNIACGKTADITVLNEIQDKVSNSIKGHSNSWQIGLAYYF